jgi:hypothetical protein
VVGYEITPGEEALESYVQRNLPRDYQKEETNHLSGRN